MITNILKYGNSNILASHYTTTSDALKGKKWGPKDDGEFTLYLDKDVNNFSLKVYFPYRVKDLKEVVLEYDYIGNDTGIYGEPGVTFTTFYEYSDDGFNWYELPYKQYEGMYFKVVHANNNLNETKKYYSSYNFDDLKYAERCLLQDESELNLDFNQNSLYIFKYNDKYVYNGFSFSYFRVRIERVYVRWHGQEGLSPFTLKKFKVFSDEKLDVTEPLLTLTGSRYFRQTFFEDMKFIPDTTELFFKMIESNNYIDSNRYTNISKDSTFDMIIAQTTKETDVKVEDVVLGFTI